MSRALRLIAAASVLTLTAYFVATVCTRAEVRAGSGGKWRRATEQAASVPHESLAIIVNRTNPIDNLSFAELRQYFLGERTRWPNGRRVTLVMLDTSLPEREAVLRIVYEMREQDFHEHFLRAKFTGELPEEPRLLDTTSRVVGFVFLQSGAVGYVRADEASPKVKVLRLDGLLPGEPGYKLTL